MMARTYFQDFTKDDDTPITVEYSFSPGSETTYSPAYGACGGDACEVEIISSWPRSEEYERLVERKMNLETTPFGKPRSLALMGADDLHQLNDLEAAIAKGDKAAELTDAERERMEAWICEHHEYEPYEPEIDF